MSIITISRGTHSWGREVAEKTAQRLGYGCIAREVLIEASGKFNIAEIQLLHAIKDAPSILDRFTYGREKYIAYIQSALLKHLKKDNVVYHGLAGHFFVRDIPHVLRVRIIADFDDRVSLVMQRDRVSRPEAVSFIKRLDQQRRRWSKHLYGIDTWDPALYDMVLHIDKLTVQDAVEIITYTINLKEFQTTAESSQALDDLALSAEVKAALIEIKPDIEVTSVRGSVTVTTNVHESKETELLKTIEEITLSIPGVKEIRLNAFPAVPYGD